MTDFVVCGVPVFSIVLCRVVLSGLDVEADGVVCWLERVLSVSEVDVTDTVDNDDSVVSKEV